MKEGESDESHSDSSLSMSTAISVSMDTEKSVLGYVEEGPGTSQNEVISPLKPAVISVMSVQGNLAYSDSGVQKPNCMK